MNGLLKDILDKCYKYTEYGSVANYIPELAKADAGKFGICVIFILFNTKIICSSKFLVINFQMFPKLDFIGIGSIFVFYNIILYIFKTFYLFALKSSKSGSKLKFYHFLSDKF